MSDQIKNDGNGFIEQNFTSLFKFMGAIVVLAGLALAAAITYLYFHPTF